MGLACGIQLWGPRLALLLGTSLSGESAWGTLQDGIFPVAAWETASSPSHSSGRVEWAVHWCATKLEAQESGELLVEVTAISHQINRLKYYLLKPCCRHPLHGDTTLKLRGERDDAAHQRHHICLQLLCYHLQRSSTGDISEFPEQS